MIYASCPLALSSTLGRNVVRAPEIRPGSAQPVSDGTTSARVPERRWCGTLLAILFAFSTLSGLWSAAARRFFDLNAIRRLSLETHRSSGFPAGAFLFPHFHFPISISPLWEHRGSERQLRHLGPRAALTPEDLAFSFAFPLPEARSHLTVHEWGTFTSIAGPDGVAVDWLPLTGSTDLPSFIEHLENADFKGGLRGTIRMETPVLYFYSPQETTVSVHATFCKGLITEWYPHASVPAIDPRRDFALEQKPTEGSITWDSVQIEPLGPADFPTASSANRYYAARQTASARLTVNSSAGPQHEKFLFYRGVSATLAPLTVALSADGTVWLQNQQPGGCPAGSETRAGSHGTAETLPPEASGGGAFLLSALQKTGQPSVRHSLAVSSRTVAAKLPSENTPKEIPDIILFERRGSRVGYHILGPLSDQASFAQPALDGSLEALSSDLEGMLIGQGLFADEAHAMLETWKSSWFEEGSRVLYLVPRPFVDSVLPLTITPAPAQITRVFVGRIELVTPATEQAVESAFAANDRATLAKYSRFLDTIIRVMRESATDQPTRDRLDNDLNTAFSTFYSPSHN